ncbi:hypothetical protein HYDPIDRAFT_79182 [Hydnomerulius pinastri MD-312]|nr:hypothetical protein HYDPIDRAFT_79182 [Hydnomerulius pinastri MD-312]
MVHLRLNEHESNPNPHVNFISVLPMADAEVEDTARQLLRALAAQVKPIMKSHGFVVNSLEEYEYNRVFAGRNWNAGETVELVLRTADGSLQPIHWLMSTLCHELAHIKHMNHGPAFQALWRQLRQEVRALQNRGYYGDGYWSSGTRLADSARIAGQGIEMGDLPEYMCGGAHTRARPTSYKRNRRRRDGAGPSNHTGAQTSKKRKAGSRVTNSSAFKSTGKALNEDVDEERKGLGTGFRKKAGSKRAREERALAAERRVQALQGGTSASGSATPSRSAENSDEEDDEEDAETDTDRRRTLLETIDQKDLHLLGVSKYDPDDDEFMFPGASANQESGDLDDVQIVNGPGTAFTDGTRGVSSSVPSRRKRSPSEAPATQSTKRPKVSQSELPLTGQGRFSASTPGKKEPETTWDCLVCTL